MAATSRAALELVTRMCNRTHRSNLLRTSHHITSHHTSTHTHTTLLVAKGTLTNSSSHWFLHQPDQRSPPPPPVMQLKLFRRDSHHWLPQIGLWSPWSWFSFTELVRLAGGEGGLVPAWGKLRPGYSGTEGMHSRLEY